MNDGSAKNVLIEKMSSSVAIITLNRPEAANALSKKLLFEFHGILQELKNDGDIRAVILTGAGEKAFCAGADLKERKEMSENEARRTVRLIAGAVSELASLPQPVIAALNGAAFGGGMELALACDLRIGSLNAQMGLTETSLGIIPGAGGTQRLPRLIGPGKAKELIFTAKRLNAREAESIGLLEYAVPANQLQETALKWAADIAKNAPLALIQSKVAINKGLEVDLETGLKIEELAYSALIPSQDRLEGLKAFAEKRPPVFKGR